VDLEVVARPLLPEVLLVLEEQVPVEELRDHLVLVVLVMVEEAEAVEVVEVMVDWEVLVEMVDLEVQAVLAEGQVEVL
jgi:hypothetical protein